MPFSRSRNLIPCPGPAAPRCLGFGGLGWRANISPLLLQHRIPHPPRFSLGFSKTFDPEKGIGSRFGKAETNQLPFEGVESDKKREGMPGLTDPKPPRCLDELKDEQGPLPPGVEPSALGLPAAHGIGFLPS